MATRLAPLPRYHSEPLASHPGVRATIIGFHGRYESLFDDPSITTEVLFRPGEGGAVGFFSYENHPSSFPGDSRRVVVLNRAECINPTGICGIERGAFESVVFRMMQIARQWQIDGIGMKLCPERLQEGERLVTDYAFEVYSADDSSFAFKPLVIPSKGRLARPPCLALPLTLRPLRVLPTIREDEEEAASDSHIEGAAIPITVIPPTPPPEG